MLPFVLSLDNIFGEASRQWRMPPFPHAVIPGAVVAEQCEEWVRQFPPLYTGGWRTHSDAHAYLLSGRTHDLPVGLDRVLEMFDSLAWVDMLRQLTGDMGLAADILHMGGGIQSIPKDGHVGLHLDGTVHPLRKDKFRRVCVMLFVGGGWHQNTGGELVFDFDDASVTVAPLQGTLVMFETGPSSWHRTEKVRRDWVRQAFVCYYFSPLRDGEAVPKERGVEWAVP